MLIQYNNWSKIMFLGPHKMEMSHFFVSLWYPLELGTFLISEDPPPNFELFPTETWDFFDFSTTPPPLNAEFPSFVAFSIGKLPLCKSEYSAWIFNVSLFMHFLFRLFGVLSRRKIVLLTIQMSKITLSLDPSSGLWLVFSMYPLRGWTRPWSSWRSWPRGTLAQGGSFVKRCLNTYGRHGWMDLYPGRFGTCMTIRGFLQIIMLRDIILN